MMNKFFKILMANIIIANFFCPNTIFAYDLPKIVIDDQSETIDDDSNKSNTKETPVIDNNYIFIGEYKGLKYYLDRYSIKIKKNKTDHKSWSQFIFPIGANVISKNSKSTIQKFTFDGINAYNSMRKSNKIDEIKDVEDKEFLYKCFKVGYNYAFKQK